MDQLDNVRLLKMAGILSDRARNNQPISYSDLYLQLGLNTHNAADRTTGSHLLAAVNDVSYQEKGVFLGAFVFGAAINQPYEGFWEYAKEKGKLPAHTSPEKKYDFWINHMADVHKAYGENQHKFSEKHIGT